jgi:pimeloyl-ACP methyl ester carboxylesterase
MDARPADFVLIHSTGQGAAGWERVICALSQRGHAAHAVELPDDANLSAAGFAELVGQQVGDLASPVVLAHSGSGPLLPAAARLLGARRQLWLAAWVPDEHATFVEEVADHAEAAFNPDWIGKDPIEDDEVAASFVYHDCDAATLAWALSTRRGFLPRAVYTELIELARDIPSTYIVASEDRTIRPDWQRRMARERLGVEPAEIASGHCPNVSQPERLAAMLGDVVA